MLALLYDEDCAFCRRCRAWLEGRRSMVPLLLVPSDSPAARALTGGRVPHDGRELVVVDDRGAYWAGPDAFLVCLWALEGYRGWATLLAFSWLRPFARAFFAVVSRQRGLLSRLFPDQAAREGPCCGGAIDATLPLGCEGRHAGHEPHLSPYR